MKLFCCFTPAHEVLYREYFRPTVPAGFTVEAIRMEISGAGDFLSAEFLRCISQKVDLILQSILDHPGEVILWSDIDIQFFGVRPEDLLTQLSTHAIAVQREGHRIAQVNTGFFVCRCDEPARRFFEQIKEGLQQNPATNEQTVANILLASPQTASLAWTYLPFTYYARTHGWPPPRDLVMYHANETAGRRGVERKIRQFREFAFLRRFRWLALLVTAVKYAPKRLRRLLSGRPAASQG